MVSETPTFDLEQDPPPTAEAPISFMAILVWGLMWPALIVVWAQHGFNWWNTLLWPPVLYAVIAIHELGHVAAGKIVGMRMEGIVVGGLALHRAGERWRVSFHPRSLGPQGFAMCVPDKKPLERERVAWFVAGGPIASLLLALIAGTALRMFGSGAHDWIAAAFWTNFFLMCLSLVGTDGVHVRDATRFHMLRSKPEEAQAYIALIRLYDEIARGRAPREWSPEAIDGLLKTPAHAPEYIMSRLFAYYRYRDLGDEATALQFLEHGLATAAVRRNTARQACYFEAAFAHGIICRNPGCAKVWRDRALQLGKTPSTAPVDAAIAYADERYDDAIRLFKEARSILDKQKAETGYARWAREVWSDYEQRCRTAVHS